MSTKLEIVFSITHKNEYIIITVAFNACGFCVQSKEIDGSIFPPIGQLIKEITKTGCTFDVEENDDMDDKIQKKIPAHAILPDSAEEEQELPVHNDDKYVYHHHHHHQFNVHFLPR